MPINVPGDYAPGARIKDLEARGWRFEAKAERGDHVYRVVSAPKVGGQHVYDEDWFAWGVIAAVFVGTGVSGPLTPVVRRMMPSGSVNGGAPDAGVAHPFTQSPVGG